jgi:flavin reductase (DIM6/NTAB) family NADH-FMN oxidoreductase RutF
VAPRPIAWVSTISAAGQPNLAPFSFFQLRLRRPSVAGVCARTSVSLSSPEAVTTAKPKTRCGIFAKPGNLWSTSLRTNLAEAMNLTSGEYDPSVNEFEVAKLTPQPSKVVRPPRVAESPVSFECKLHQILDFSTAPTSYV